MRFDAALKNMPYGLCMFDRDERVIVRNERYSEIIAFMGAKQVVKVPRKGPYDITAYQTSHL